MNLSRWKVLIFVLVAIAILAGLSFLNGPQRPEPVYRGTTLTQWLKQLDDGQASGISSSALPSFTPSQIEAAEAIHAIGSGALPLLMQDIHERPPEDAVRFRIEARINRIVGRLFRTRIWFSDITEKDRIRWRAAQGLAALGLLAKPALPELKRLVYTNFFHSSIKEAAYALAHVGPEGIEFLANAVTNTPRLNEWSAMCAIWAIGQTPAAGTNVIPFLIGATTSASDGIACGAVQVLGLFHTDGEHVIPALMSAVGSGRPDLESCAARSLGAFGPQAAAAVPLLQSLTTNRATRDGALAGLRKIQQPEPLPKPE